MDSTRWCKILHIQLNIYLQTLKTLNSIAAQISNRVWNRSHVKMFLARFLDVEVSDWFKLKKNLCTIWTINELGFSDKI